MDQLKLIELILGLKKENTVDESESFIEIGKIYAIRTVTMIYTGRLKSFNKNI